jgi:hypothetical protein
MRRANEKVGRNGDYKWHQQANAVLRIDALGDEAPHGQVRKAELR